MHGVAHDFGDGITAFEVIIPEDKPYFCVAYLIHFSGNVFAVYVDLSLVLFIQPADDVEQSRFARTALTKNCDESSIRQFKRHVFEHSVPVAGAGIEYLSYVFNLYHLLPLLNDLRILCPLILRLNPKATNSTMSNIIISMKK